MPIHTVSRLIARVAGKFPLRTVLIVPFVVQIVGTVGLVGYFSFKSGQNAVEDLAQQLMTQVGERVSDRLTTYLQSPQTAVSANHLAVKQGILNINNFEQLRQHLWQQLTLNPSLEALYFGNASGEEIGYGRFQGEETVKQAEKLTGENLSIGTPYISILRSADPGKRKYYLVDSKGNPRKLIYTLPIDNHTTMWYRTAEASKQQTWSPISVYKVLPLLGIFAVTPIYDEAGKWQGVFASSFTLSAISTFLDRLDFSPSGQVFIMERSGKLVATSTEESLLLKPTKGEATQLLAVNSKDTRTRDIAQQLSNKFGNFRTLQATQQLTLFINNEHQFVRVTPYRDKYGLDWLIVTVVPESDFMEQIHANTRTTILLCIAALLGSLGVGVITASWITKPIVRLNTAAKDIAKGHWNQSVESQRADEIGELTNSFNQMAAQLQQSEKLLADYNRSLETKVAQRTAELTYTNEQLQREITERKLLEGKLYSSTQQVRTIFESITDIVLIIDEKKSLQLIPTKAIDWYACDTNQLNSIVQQFFQEGKEEIWFAKVRQALETQQTVNFDYSLRINNQEVWFAAKISPLPNRSVVWVARDISDAVAAATQRKLVEQEIRQLSTALENAVEGISRLDTQGRYIAVNKAYANTVGYQPEEMIGMEWQPTVHPDDVENMIAAYQEMLSTGKVEAEARGIRKDGSIFYKQLVMVTAYDEQHNFIGHYCFMKDISDKKQAQEALQHQLAVIEAANDGIAILNSNSEYIYLNKAHVTLFGYTDTNKLIGKTWKELYYPEEISRFERDVFPILLQQGNWQGEATGKKQDGTTFAEEISLTLIEGKGLICVCQDITQRKQVEAALRESQAQLNTIFTHSLDGIMILDRQGKIQFANPATKQLLNVGQENLIDYQWGIPLSATAELDLTQVNGESGIVEMKSTPIQWMEKQAFLVALRDISDRKRAETALQEREEQLQLALEGSGDGFWDWNIQTGEAYLSPRYLEMLGYEANELPPELSTWDRLIHPDDKPWVMERLNAHLADSSIPYQFDYRVLTKSGTWKWIANYGKVVARDENGTPWRMTGTHRDVSDKKRAELALRESEQRYLGIIEDQIELIARFRPDGTLSFVNEAYCRYFGLTREQLIGHHYTPRIVEEDREYVDQLVNSISLENPLVTIENRVIVGGEVRWTQWINRAIFDEQGRLIKVQAVGRDITDKKLAQQQLEWKEALLCSMTSASPLAFFVVDNRTNAILYFNHRFCEIWGIEHLEERMQQGVLTNNDIIPDCILVLKDVVAFAESCKPLQSEENRIVIEDEIPFVDGRTIRRFSAQIRDTSDRYFGRLYIFEDISDRKRAEQSLQESAQREKAIATVMQQMRQTLDIDTIFNATTKELRQVMKCDRVVVYQFNSDWSGKFVSESVGDGWISLMQQQTNPNTDEQLLNDPSCTLKTTMLKGTAEPVVDSYLQKTKGGAYNGGINYRVTPDIYQTGFTECYLELLQRFQIRAYIIVPIHCGNQLWGLLATYQNSDSRAWKESEINTVVQIGIQLGVAWQQAQLLQQTQQQAVQLQLAKDAAVSAATQSADANRAKSQFLANMSHELRTPLNGILGYAQILQADKNCTPKQKKGVDIIHQCGTHLLTLINDILDLSKIESGKIELYPEDFYLPSLLTSLFEIFQLKATQKSITFTYLPLNQLPKVIHADQKRLRQVLMNLLSNAVKFTDRGSVTFKVELVHGSWFMVHGSSDSLSREASYMVHDNEQDASNVTSDALSTTNHQPSTMNNEPSTITKIRFQIEDTGIGIPEEHLEKIFLPFEQVGDISRRAEGTGLGLAITQKIIELMGGKLFVESTPGVGSKFGFDLDVPVVSNPINSTTVKSTHNIIGYELIKAEGRRQKAEPGVREEGKKWKILIVDDRWENRTVLINILEPLGFELEQAADGQEGLEKALEFQPDLILADLVMPVMDGYQMTRQLRQLREFQTTIIIAISANAFEVDRLQSKDAGCNDFLPKPIQSEDLLEKIKSYLNLSWIYDTPSETKSQLKGDESSRYSQKLTTEMVIPPKEELLALYEAADSGFVSGVKTEALRLEQLNPDYSPFATRILELAADFEYEEIAKLVDHYLSDNPE